MMRSLAVWVTVAGVLAPGPLHGQTRDLAARLDPELLRAVQPILESAREDSLPLAALESKVLEGAAKGVPIEQIRAAALRLASELRYARGVLRAGLPEVALAEGEITATALAIRQGVPPEELLGLWQAGGEHGSLEIPLVVVGELVRRGIPSDASVRLMIHAIESGTPLNTAAQIPSKLDFHLPGATGPQAALHQAFRSLGIPLPPRGGRPGG